eukprot:1157528-Pelagomonas_calceolata.AAC.4
MEHDVAALLDSLNGAHAVCVCTCVQKDMGLHPYAEQFAQAGMAVLVIDYRGFGGSDGLPRHHISWHKHLEVRKDVNRGLTKGSF